MQDAIFALGAQLAYYNWHDYKLEDKDMYTILKNQRILGEVLTKEKIKGFKEENTSFIEKINGKDVTIYKETDKRLIMMYSENRDKSDLEPLFRNLFEGWNFLEGMDHNKAYKETITEFEVKRKVKKCSWMGLSKEDSGFQAFAMEKGMDILISYRGTDFGTFWDAVFAGILPKWTLRDSAEEFDNDMFSTNIKIFSEQIPDQVLCTIYFYLKIKEKYPAKNIHITGHSLGGGLAQFAAIYGETNIKETKTWNGLGVKSLYEELEKEKLRLESYLSSLESNNLSKNENESKEHYTNRLNEVNLLISRVNQIVGIDEFSKKPILSVTENEKILKELKIEMDGTYENPFNELWKIRILSKFKYKNKALEERLINYSLHGDLVKKLSVQNGRNICVDALEESSEDGGLWETVKTKVEGGNFDWHGINNFLPFFDDSGNITVEALRDNYIKNYLKTLFIDLQSKTPKFKETFQTSKRGDIRLRDYTPITILEEFMSGNIQDITELTNLFSKKYLLSYNISELISKLENKTSEYFIYVDNINISKEITLGAFNNCSILCGVIGKDYAKVTQMPPGVKSFSYIQLNGNQISKSKNA